MVKKKVGVLKVIDLNYTLLILLALILGCKETPIIIDKDSTIQIASISSSIQDMDVNYSVYLPPSYESGGPFPVLYLLHGYYGNHLDWPRNGMRQIMDRELNSGNSTEMIVIMPDGMDSFYIDDFDEQNYPNPFNPSTYIEFYLPQITQVSLTLYNQIGNKIIDIIDGEFLSGNQSVMLNLNSFASGLYFYRLTTPENSITKTMTLIK